MSGNTGGVILLASEGLMTKFVKPLTIERLDRRDVGDLARTEIDPPRAAL